MNKKVNHTWQFFNSVRKWLGIGFISDYFGVTVTEALCWATDPKVVTDSLNNPFNVLINNSKEFKFLDRLYEEGHLALAQSMVNIICRRYKGTFTPDDNVSPNIPPLFRKMENGQKLLSDLLMAKSQWRSPHEIEVLTEKLIKELLESELNYEEEWKRRNLRVRIGVNKIPQNGQIHATGL